MKVNQIYTILNDVYSEITGKNDVIQENLSNVIDIGKQILTNEYQDNYVKALINRIGREIYVSRQYKGRAPRVYMDSWEFGSVMAKIRANLPKVQENETWKLVNGQVYEQDQFYQPEVFEKLYNETTTWEIPVSFTEVQLKESFLSIEGMNRFYEMIFTQIENAIEMYRDAMQMRLINNMAAQTVYDEYNGNTTATNLATTSHVRAVNLLYLYNQAKGTNLSKNNALYDKEFLRFAITQIGLYTNRMQYMTSLFNENGTDKFTPKELQHVVLHTDFAKTAQTYLESDTFWNDLVKLPMYTEVAYWQGTGTNFSFEQTSELNIITPKNNSVNFNGLIGVIFDRDALGLTNYNRRTTTHYNAKAEFYNNYYKVDARYFNDFDENFVAFIIA